jgi:hypothetical protein
MVMPFVNKPFTATAYPKATAEVRGRKEHDYKQYNEPFHA